MQELGVPPGRQLCIVMLVAAGLAGVFLLYTQPDFMVQLSNQFWACF